MFGTVGGVFFRCGMDKVDDRYCFWTSGVMSCEDFGENGEEIVYGLLCLNGNQGRSILICLSEKSVSLSDISNILF